MRRCASIVGGLRIGFVRSFLVVVGAFLVAVGAFLVVCVWVFVLWFRSLSVLFRLGRLGCQFVLAVNEMSIPDVSFLDVKLQAQTGLTLKRKHSETQSNEGFNLSEIKAET